jgi:superfamily I DNA/RNA helicase
VALNEAQSQAAQYSGGPCMLIAGPGSGKTLTLVEKYAHLLRNGERPDRIMCLTFSAEAAKEMRKRIAAKTGFREDSLKESVSTFHSLALRIIRAEKDLLGWKLADFHIVGGGEDRKILRELVRRDMIPTAKRFISKMRRLLLSPEEAFRGAVSQVDLLLSEVYGQYDEALREDGVVDFDAMVYYAVKILSSNKQALERWQARANHLIVDEAHDNSHDQVQLARLLTACTGNLTTIFDLSQSIYSFRGAQPALLLEESETSAKFYLNANHRCARNIIKSFKPFAEPDELSQKLMAETYAVSTEDGNVFIEEFSGEYDQARAVCEEIMKSGIEYDKVGVLARTKAVLFPYCELFEERGIPYFWRGKNIWLSPEIQDVVAFARFAIDPTDAKAFVQICTSQIGSCRYIGRKFAEAVIRQSRTSILEVEDVSGFPENKSTSWDVARSELLRLREIRNGKPVDFFREIQRMSGIGVYDSQNQEPDDFSQENVSAMVRRADRFLSLAEFVVHARKMSMRSQTSSGVTLSTIHGAKGLEWSAVFIVGVSDKILPHARALEKREERRLMYVALSRGRTTNWVTWHGNKSEFIEEIPFEPKYLAGKSADTVCLEAAPEMAGL